MSTATATEICAECGGTGRIVQSWDFGAGIDTDCDPCGGTGQIALKDLYRQEYPTKDALTDLLNGALVEVYKRRITEQLTAESPIMAVFKGKVEEAERRIGEHLEKTMFGAPSDGSAV